MDLQLPEALHSLLQTYLSNRRVNNYTLEINPGSNKGDNYLGTLYRVKITSGETIINLIIKSATSDENFRKIIPIREFYQREIYLYNEILPMYQRMQQNLTQNEIFKNYPDIFLTSLDQDRDECLFMSDLSALSYKHVDKRLVLDLGHSELFIKTIAKFHALAFALKAQDEAKFKEIAAKTPEIFLRRMDVKDLNQHAEKIRELNDNCFGTDPVVWKKMDNFTNNIIEDLLSLLDPEAIDEYSVIIHGDCWSNNFLFKYDGEDPTRPTELYLIDFQESRVASPVCDLSVFMCNSLDYESLVSNFDYLVQLYHTSVIDFLKKLDVNDPISLFPFSKLEEQFTKFFKTGLAFAIKSIPLLLQDDSNVDIQTAVNQNSDGNFLTALDDCCKTGNDEEIAIRLSGLIQFAANRNFI